MEKVLVEGIDVMYAVNPISADPIAITDVSCKCEYIEVRRDGREYNLTNGVKIGELLSWVSCR